MCIVKILKWGKTNFEGIRQKLSTVDREMLFASKGTFGKWEAFKSQREREGEVKVNKFWLE